MLEHIIYCDLLGIKYDGKVYDLIMHFDSYFDDFRYDISKIIIVTENYVYNICENYLVCKRGVVFIEKYSNSYNFGDMKIQDRVTLLSWYLHKKHGINIPSEHINFSNYLNFSW